MKNLRLNLTILLALIISCSAVAQQRWSLQMCINHAQENNLQIKQQQIGVEKAHNNLFASKMSYIPSVNASMGHNMSWGRSVNLNDLEIVENKLTQSTNLNFSASLPIFEGMQKHNRVKSNIKQLEIAQMGIENIKDEISIAITQAFLQVLLSKEIEKSALESYKSVEEQVSRTRVLVEEGSQAYSSLLEIEAQLANERVQLIGAKNNVRSSLLNLAQLLDLESAADFEIEEPQHSNMPVEFTQEEIEEIYNLAAELPRIKSVELALEQSKLQYKIQKGAALPSISLNAGYGTYYSDNQKTAFFKQFDNNRNPSMGFSLTIPIFNNWRSNSGIRNAKLDIKNSEIELKKAHQTLKKDIQQAYNDAVSSLEKYSAAEQNVKLARETFKFTQEKFDLGMVNGTDFNVAKTNLFKSESEYYQSKYQYIFQIKILDYYRGIPLTL